MGTEIIDGYTINLEGNEAPWGAIEEAVIRRLIARLEDVRDQVAETATPNHNDLLGLDTGDYRHVTIEEKNKLHDKVSLGTGDNPLRVDNQELQITTGHGINKSSNQLNSIVVNITNPTLEELQTMITNGVNIFHISRTNGTPELPEGTLNLLNKDYTFTGDESTQLICGNTIIVFPTGGQHTVRFDCTLKPSADTVLTVTNAYNPIEIRRLEVTDDGEFSVPDGARIETLILGGASNQIVELADEEIIYQYLATAGGKIVDNTYEAITQCRQEDWVRPHVAFNISAQINNPTLAELQALVDRGVTVFYGGSLGGHPTLPSGTLQLKPQTYYFISHGYEGYGFRTSGDLNLVFTTVAGSHDIVFKGDLELGGDLLMDNVGGFLYVDSLSTSTNVLINVSSIMYVEYLNISHEVVEAGGTVYYQYRGGGGTLAKTIGGEDISSLRHLQWVRNDQADWNAEFGNSEILNKPLTLSQTVHTSVSRSTENGLEILCDNTADITILLESTLTDPRGYWCAIRKELDNPSTVTIDGNGRLINGQPTQVLSFISDGLELKYDGVHDEFYITQDSRGGETTTTTTNNALGKESPSGVAETSHDANVDITQNIETLYSITQSLTPVSGQFSLDHLALTTTAQKMPFTVTSQASDTDVMEFYEVTDTIAYKKVGINYDASAQIIVSNNSMTDRVFTIEMVDSTTGLVIENPLGEPRRLTAQIDRKLNNSSPAKLTPVNLLVKPFANIDEDLVFYYRAYVDSGTDCAIESGSGSIGTTGGGSVGTLQDVIENSGEVDYSDETEFPIGSRIMSFLKNGTRTFSLFEDGRMLSLKAEIAELLSDLIVSVDGLFENLVSTFGRFGTTVADDAVVVIGEGSVGVEKYFVIDSGNHFSGDYIEDTATGSLFPSESKYKTWIISGTNKRLRPIAYLDGGNVAGYALSDEVTPTQYSVLHQVTQDCYYQNVPNPDGIEGVTYDGTGIYDAYNAGVTYVPAQAGDSLKVEGDATFEKDINAKNVEASSYLGVGAYGEGKEDRTLITPNRLRLYERIDGIQPAHSSELILSDGRMALYQSDTSAVSEYDILVKKNLDDAIAKQTEILLVDPTRAVLQSWVDAGARKFAVKTTTVPVYDVTPVNLQSGDYVFRQAHGAPYVTSFALALNFGDSDPYPDRNTIRFEGEWVFGEFGTNNPCNIIGAEADSIYIEQCSGSLHSETFHTAIYNIIGDLDVTGNTSFTYQYRDEGSDVTYNGSVLGVNSSQAPVNHNWRKTWDSLKLSDDVSTILSDNANAVNVEAVKAVLNDKDYLTVRDIRDIDGTPDYFSDKTLTPWFSDDVSGSSNNWDSGITVKGWEGNFYSWQLMSNSDAALTDQNLYFRNGSGTTWGARKKILDSSNYSDYALPLTGGTLDGGTNTTLTVLSDDVGESVINAYGATQGTGRVYVGQSATYGGGIEYNGDGSPSGSGIVDAITLFRRENGVNSWTAKNSISNNDWEFRGNVTSPLFISSTTDVTKFDAENRVITTSNVRTVDKSADSGTTTMNTYPTVLNGSKHAAVGTYNKYIRITVPTPIQTMMKFTLDIYNYDDNSHFKAGGCSIEISGYPIGTAWLATGATCNSANPMEYEVVFQTHVTTKAPYILIKRKDGDFFDYPIVSIRDVMVGFNGGGDSKWYTDWGLLLTNDLLPDMTTDATYNDLKPRANLLSNSTVADIDADTTGKALITKEYLGELRITLPSDTTVDVTSTSTSRSQNCFVMTAGTERWVDQYSMSFGAYRGYDAMFEHTGLPFTVTPITNGYRFSFADENYADCEITIKAIGNTDINQLVVS